MSSFSKHDFNREAGQGLEKALSQLQVIAYEVAKATILFIESMVKMFFGKN
jgi:hypothetical protein